MLSFWAQTWKGRIGGAVCDGSLLCLIKNEPTPWRRSRSSTCRVAPAEPAHQWFVPGHVQHHPEASGAAAWGESAKTPTGAWRPEHVKYVRWAPCPPVISNTCVYYLVVSPPSLFCKSISVSLCRFTVHFRKVLGIFLVFSFFPG